MALKTDIHEKCKKCGVVVAKVTSRGIAWNPSACKCKDDGPRDDGPQSPPRTVSFHSANFIPADPSIPKLVSYEDARAFLEKANAVDPKAETVELPVVPEIAFLPDTPEAAYRMGVRDGLRQAASAVICDDCESGVALHGAYHAVEFQRKGLCPAGPVRVLRDEAERAYPNG